jgi:hypothetical protein
MYIYIIKVYSNNYLLCISIILFMPSLEKASSQRPHTIEESWKTEDCQMKKASNVR